MFRGPTCFNPNPPTEHSPALACGQAAISGLVNTGPVQVRGKRSDPEAVVVSQHLEESRLPWSRPAADRLPRILLPRDRRRWDTVSRTVQYHAYNRNEQRKMLTFFCWWHRLLIRFSSRTNINFRTAILSFSAKKRVCKRSLIVLYISLRETLHLQQLVWWKHFRAQQKYYSSRSCWLWCYCRGLTTIFDIFLILVTLERTS